MKEEGSERSQLRQAIKDCRERRLSEASRWAALQLSGMTGPPDDQATPSAPADQPASGSLEEEDAYQLAVAHFDFRVRTC